jgi:hypothetical protein
MPVILPLIAVASTAVAGAAVEDQGVAAALSALPETLADLERQPHQDLMVYRGGPNDPVIIVSITGYDKPLDDEILRGMAILARRADKAQTKFEGRFVPSSGAAAKGFFGEYSTDKDLRQVWVLQRDGLLTVVSATLRRIDERQRFRDLVTRDLFGGGSIQAQQ